MSQVTPDNKIEKKRVKLLWNKMMRNKHPNFKTKRWARTAYRLEHSQF
jgi:hypothetical protein